MEEVISKCYNRLTIKYFFVKKGLPKDTTTKRVKLIEIDRLELKIFSKNNERSNSLKGMKRD